MVCVFPHLVYLEMRSKMGIVCVLTFILWVKSNISVFFMFIDNSGFPVYVISIYFLDCLYFLLISRI